MFFLWLPMSWDPTVPRRWLNLFDSNLLKNRRRFLSFGLQSRSLFDAGRKCITLFDLNIAERVFFGHRLFVFLINLTNPTSIQPWKRLLFDFFIDIQRLIFLCTYADLLSFDEVWCLFWFFLLSDDYLIIMVFMFLFFSLFTFELISQTWWFFKIFLFLRRHFILKTLTFVFLHVNWRLDFSFCRLQKSWFLWITPNFYSFGVFFISFIRNGLFLSTILNYVV